MDLHSLASKAALNTKMSCQELPCRFAERFSTPRIKSLEGSGKILHRLSGSINYPGRWNTESRHMLDMYVCNLPINVSAVYSWLQ